MTSHESNLAAVRAACVAANPSIVRDESIEYVTVRDEYNGDISSEPEIVEGREVTLSDVLIAIGEMRSKPSEDNIARRLDLELKGGELFIYQSNSVVGEAWWNLRLPLSGQSEDTARYIASLLDYHHDTARA